MNQLDNPAWPKANHRTRTDHLEAMARAGVERVVLCGAGEAAKIVIGSVSRERRSGSTGRTTKTGRLCNRYKGSQIQGVDSLRGEMVKLFNPLGRNKTMPINSCPEDEVVQRGHALYEQKIRVAVDKAVCWQDD